MHDCNCQLSWKGSISVPIAAGILWWLAVDLLLRLEWALISSGRTAGTPAGVAAATLTGIWWSGIWECEEDSLFCEFMEVVLVLLARYFAGMRLCRTLRSGRSRMM